ncbi:hypothetical protein [Bradyrhizobium sp. AUGA SZCCT0182]|uniref:hypothetical protein n=1 Tax=Bradyrhizobium sp. AUGA SZCCT0182 TaxID=2807667 RepID=UPI001BAB7241|nr:hypothetical protein [Bradyrhizobium sp. AUGA SZCCT0182]MBR1232042.1 hypothetical protein [Bradyrhizobium sp. AUGA SZCCT0182]
MLGRKTIDWPVIGALAAVAVVGGVVGYQAITLLRSDATPTKSPPLLAGYGSSVERSAYDIPGFAGSGSDERPLSFPLIRLIDPDRLQDEIPERPISKGAAPTAKAPVTEPKKARPVEEPAKAAPNSSEVKVAKLTPTETAPPATAAPARAEQWRVVPTANASYFNLGGHIDRVGVVDSLATPHLRDAFKKHSKFGQLPPEIRTHILSQNIDLPRIAPYRNLLGMDDKVLEQEQAVRFVRIR